MLSLKTDIHIEKKLYSQLRFEYNNNDLNKCKLFDVDCQKIFNWRYKDEKCINNCFISADTWVFHSNFNIIKKERNNFKIEYGRPASDQIFPLLFLKNEFEILNDPYLIKTYHHHKTNIRNYNHTQTIWGDWLFIVPTLPKDLK